MAALTKLVDGTLDPTLIVQRGLRRPDVESDSEAREAGLDPSSNLRGRPPTNVVCGVAAHGRSRRPDRVRNAPRQVLHVGAVVAVLWDGLATADRNHARA